ncbi:hypothetical protein V1290_000359 [Bradyrhizobium sp. AZCC 1578]
MHLFAEQVVWARSQLGLLLLLANYSKSVVYRDDHFETAALNPSSNFD